MLKFLQLSTFIAMVFSMLSLQLQAQFTTKWSIPAGTSNLTFQIETVGNTAYNWTAGSNSGNGTWSGVANGPVTITVNNNVSTTLTLEIASANLRRWAISDVSKLRLTNVTNWGTSPWNSMENMFYGCENLNITGAPTPPNLTNVTNMNTMFYQCSALNGPLNIGSWNVSNVTSMFGMFNFASAFNQPIGSWNVSNVEYFTQMFWYAASFDQPLDNWNVSKAANMYEMFSNATSFNQDLGNWKLYPSANLGSMLDNSGMDCANYSATLNGWKQNNPTVNALTLGASGLMYGTNATSSRNALINTQGWTINGDLPSGIYCDHVATEETAGIAMKIYPNPTTGMISIQTDVMIKNIKVTDIQGRALSVPDLNESSIDLSVLNNGMYLLHISTNHSVSLHKVIVMK